MEEIHREKPLLEKIKRFISKGKSLLLMEAFTRGGRTTLSKEIVRKLRKDWKYVIYANCRLLRVWNQEMRGNSIESFCNAITLWFMAQHDILEKNENSEIGKLIWYVKSMVALAIDKEWYTANDFPNNQDVYEQKVKNIGKIEDGWNIIWKRIGEDLEKYLAWTIELPEWAFEDPRIKHFITYLENSIKDNKPDFVINSKKTDLYFASHMDYFNAKKNFSTIQYEFSKKLESDWILSIIDEYGKSTWKKIILVLSSLQRLSLYPSFIDFEWLIKNKYSNIKLLMWDFLYEEDSYKWIKEEVNNEELYYTLAPLSLEEVIAIPEICSWWYDLKKELFIATWWRLVEIANIIDYITDINSTSIDNLKEAISKVIEKNTLELAINKTIEDFSNPNIKWWAQYQFLWSYIIHKWIWGKEIWEAWREWISQDKKDSIKNFDLFIKFWIFEYTSSWNIRVKWDILREVILRYSSRIISKLL